MKNAGFFVGTIAGLLLFAMIGAAVDPNVAHFPAISLNGKTNVISDSGTAPTWNGGAWPGGGGDTIWTNSAGTVQMTIQTNVLDLSTTNSAGTSITLNSAVDSTGQTVFNIQIQDDFTETFPNIVNLRSDGNNTNDDYTVLLNIDNNINPGSAIDPMSGFNGQYGLVSSVSSQEHPGGWQSQGNSIGSFSRASGDSLLQIGGIMLSQAGSPAKTNIGGIFRATWSNDLASNGTFNAFQAYVSPTNTKLIPPENAVGLFDATDTGLPILVGRSSNGRFAFNNDGSISSGETNQWKLGAVKAASVTASTTNYVEVIIDGATVKLIKAN